MYNKVPGTNNNHKRYLLSSSNTSLLKYTYISEKNDFSLSMNSLYACFLCLLYFILWY